MRKKQNGITLVALIITIIIMIILVSVSISIVINSGLITKAKQATEDYKTAGLYEEISMVIAERKMWEYTGTNGSLEDDLKNGISGEKTVTPIREGITDTCIVTKNGKTVTVYADGDIEEGEVELWGGITTTPVSPEFKENATEEGVWDWYISTPAQLQFLQVFVNNGNQLEGDAGSLTTIAGTNASKATMVDNKTVVYLMNNLDMGAREGSTGADVQARWEKAADGTTDSINQTSYNWTPIGITNETGEKFFKGIFDGQEHTIRGIYVNSTKSEAGNGIFGRGNTIKNLTVKNSYIKGTSNCTGGIIGCLDKGEITHCYNINTNVRGGVKVGGIVGQFGTRNGGLTFCGNSGTVTATGTGAAGAAGGLIGATADAPVSYCWNVGSVYSALGSAGGICGGYLGGTSMLVSFCFNAGSVAGGRYCRGCDFVAVQGGYEAKAYKCYNKGIVTATTNTESIGGVIGDMAADATVENCYYLNTIGVEYGVGTIAEGGNITTQRAGAKPTSYDIKTYEEFLELMTGDFSVLNDE